MSNYIAEAFHPKTRKVENATWLDNYFGFHKYGVKFSDGSIFPAKDIMVPWHMGGAVSDPAKQTTKP